MANIPTGSSLLLVLRLNCFHHEARSFFSEAEVVSVGGSTTGVVLGVAMMCVCVYDREQELEW